jgi:hypothetical protein
VRLRRACGASGQPEREDRGDGHQTKNPDNHGCGMVLLEAPQGNRADPGRTEVKHWRAYVPSPAGLSA